MVMLLLSSYVFTVVLFSMCLLLGFFSLSGRFYLSRVKVTPFECGFDPKDSARLPFSVRFFLLAVVFLVFDIEIAMLFPLVFGVTFSCYFNLTIAGLVFVIILIFGVLYEWYQGALSWVL